jgi:predicted deacetylase
VSLRQAIGQVQNNHTDALSLSKGVVPSRNMLEKLSSVEPCYLVRFDDICPTMDWRVWDRIERILVAQQIKPLLAVVPDNQDPHLVVGPPLPDFWRRVHDWQGRGWAIALHGFQHRYVNENAGMLKITRRSEFAGLSRDEQEFKLRAGVKKFTEQGIVAKAWIAPSHSFDRVTVELLPQVGLRVISDGLSVLPFASKNGVTWVPQQMWERFQPRARGVWTVCCHHNNWNEARLEHFCQQVIDFRQNITTLDEVVSRWPARVPDVRDRLHALQWRARSCWWASVRSLRWLW